MTKNDDKESITESASTESEKPLGKSESGQEEKPSEPSAAPKEKTVEDVEREYQEQINVLEDRYLRLAAEFDNYKKRTARQFEELIKTSNENLLVQILDVLDNFHRALDAAGNSSDYESLKKGMELIYQHLSEILKKEGVERIETVGKEFDPYVHDAVMKIHSDEHPDGVVAGEMSAGYKLKGKVIRHARVLVSGGKASSEEEEPTGD